jgi:DMSO/TMAO reductase YedYZ heme-binding membrane subunit
MLVPLLGLLLAIGVAVLADNRRVRRVLGWICAILALITAILTVLFILDYFQTRTIVRPQFQSVMEKATVGAIVKLICGIVGLLLISRVGFAGPKAVTRKKGVVTEPSAPSPLLPLGGTARAE